MLSRRNIFRFSGAAAVVAVATAAFPEFAAADVGRRDDRAGSDTDVRRNEDDKAYGRRSHYRYRKPYNYGKYGRK
ncbi:hypothetical protein DFR70_1011016 [Nocardia tenerifensis]|uniref:Secreted protein n=1 Tax=Nocardia tenerifensis TaxID=228006 RepID=A0A318KH44_9NOCA|nr:hypothetical protein DFR70_1011016 [Nocardia tenerifensis]